MTDPKHDTRQNEQREAAERRVKEAQQERQEQLRTADQALRRILRDAERTLRQGADVCQKISKRLTREEQAEIRRCEEALTMLKRALDNVANVRPLTSPHLQAVRDDAVRLQTARNQRKEEQKTKNKELQLDEKQRRGQSIRRLWGAVDGTEE